MRISKRIIQEFGIENPEAVIYCHKARFWPSGGYHITVLNKDTDNVIIEKREDMIYENSDDQAKTYSVPKKDIDELMELIRCSDLLFDKEKEFERSDYAVLDGQSDQFFVSNFRKCISVEEYNFILEHEGMGADTKAGQLIAIHNLVDEILKKNKIRFKQ